MAVGRFPLGQQVHVALVKQGFEAAADLAAAAGEPNLFTRVSTVAVETPSPSFLHSALCAMSLPVRRPRDEHAAIIRQDGQYTLVINPKSQVDFVDGRQQFRSLGVPFGSLPRLILVHTMTEAVRSRSRHVVLGNTFTDWMRRLGYQSISYGPRGSATLIREQLDRLPACEWMIRWDHPQANGDREFAIREIKLTNEYAGTDRKNGSFLREIRMTESFFEHLREHAVPLNEAAIRQLRDSATALDLYTWLAYRLPRINSKKAALLNWQQLAVHFGNDGKNIRKFRQTVRDAWERQVSGVYPEARAEFDTTVIRLHASPAPLQQKLISGSVFRVVTDAKGTESNPSPAPQPDQSEILLAHARSALGQAQANTWLRGARRDRRGSPFLACLNHDESKFHPKQLQYADQACRRESRLPACPRDRRLEGNVMNDAGIADSPAVHAIGKLYSRSMQVLEALRDQSASPLGSERTAPTFSITRTAELVGRTSAAIREAEKEGRIPAVARTSSNRRVGYSLKEINNMRAVFNTRPWREVGDPVSVVAVQNFKGGVGKSTVSTHLAQYLAIKGYRVCLVDCDSQGSSTALFGYVPDLDIREEDTLYPFFRNAEMTSLEYAVRPTHWDNLFLIPANLKLYSSEYELAARVARQEPQLLNRLAEGVDSIADFFDVIILDPPPALGTISLSVMRAATSLLVPMPPTVVDFTSTTTFLAMLYETLQVLEERHFPVDFSWVRFVASRADEQKSIQRELLVLMRNLLGESLLRTVLKDSAEIDNASARLMTVYDLGQPVTSRETYQRCLTYLNGANAEIELQIRLTWPSHAERLTAEGIL